MRHVSRMRHVLRMRTLLTLLTHATRLTHAHTSHTWTSRRSRLLRACSACKCNGNGGEKDAIYGHDTPHSSAEQSTYVVYVVEDGTGTIDCRLWLDAAKDSDFQAQKRAAIRYDAELVRFERFDRLLSPCCRCMHGSPSSVSLMDEQRGNLCARHRTHALVWQPAQAPGVPCAPSHRPQRNHLPYAAGALRVLEGDQRGCGQGKQEYLRHFLSRGA